MSARSAWSGTGNIGHGKHRRGHLAGQRLFDAADIDQMPGQHAELPARLIDRHEERETVDVIPVGMGQQQDTGADFAAGKVLAQHAQPGAGVEDDRLTVEQNFDATGIAAVDDVLRRSTGDAAPNSPKLDFDRHPVLRHLCPWRRRCGHAP
jgi:hypothetical protein